MDSMEGSIKEITIDEEEVRVLSHGCVVILCCIVFCCCLHLTHGEDFRRGDAFGKT